MEMELQAVKALLAVDERNDAFLVLILERSCEDCPLWGALVEKNRTSLVSTEYSGTGRSKERLMWWSPFLLCFL
jgi:hypothetical protein